MSDSASAPVPPKRMCPGCDSAMQVFHAEGVEVDRCPFCGGLFFDGGELEQVLGHEVAYEPLEGLTRRRCAACVVTLAPVRIGHVPAERCGLCHSVYLDHEELAQLTGAEVPLTRAHAPTPAAGGPGPGRERITFQCAGCGVGWDLDAGFATGRGMACTNCVGMLEETPSILPTSHVASASIHGLHRDVGLRSSVHIGSILLTVFRLFR